MFVYLQRNQIQKIMGVYSTNTNGISIDGLGMGYAGHLHNQICSDFTFQIKSRFNGRFQTAQDITMHTIRGYRYPDVSIWEWNKSTVLIKPLVVIEVCDVNNFSKAKEAIKKLFDTYENMQEGFVYYFTYNVFLRKTKSASEFEISDRCKTLNMQLYSLYENCENKQNIDQQLRERQQPYNLNGLTLY